MNKLIDCSTLQRFFCAFAVFYFLAFAKADAQQPSSIKNETQLMQSEFKVVDINVFQYLKLDIKTTNEERVRIITSQDGEYKNAVILSGQVRNDSLIVRDPINPSFSFPEDKLSAHKIIDGSATLLIPENKKIVINTNAADISITGNYADVYINQLSGTCKIARLEGNLRYISVYADLFVQLKNYDISCSSRNGKVTSFEKPRIIKYFAVLETVSGNISKLKKTKK
ncbi:hypothetical protein LX97_00914 [Nonlabens dokdonensis]|jgi:hypothetical protein|uniref:Secreted protein n=2 Tax=Nonlabens dokdonensis TaxID=328515 RepID=L7W3U4_NONDD|nr:hypothetical protein [Nonlabens dokdonensis]AGC76245.1 secreted protein [Nonlabens dokdonensis DSW-6]PZX43909.1 hypothetical protein LX97_00914 [Nonlabens dokdonensis]